MEASSQQFWRAIGRERKRNAAIFKPEPLAAVRIVVYWRRGATTVPERERRTGPLNCLSSVHMHIVGVNIVNQQLLHIHISYKLDNSRPYKRKQCKITFGLVDKEVPPRTEWSVDVF
ncbi:hypothetical protein EVAR_103420_1 [Eumeta japonica]|uniref:Uncharacterized protein n=1 Tax=Eumeta variegata TaxID=151549 RepID=A0A4C1ZA65_EUMVA|nr:hypothetical protein EVAR_103420_1 [Eumeta japonica]